MISNKGMPSCGWNSCYLVKDSQAALNGNIWITFPSVALNPHKMPLDRRFALDRNDHFREQETEIQRISQLWSFWLSPGSSGFALNSLSVLPSLTPSAFAPWASSVRHMLRKQKRLILSLYPRQRTRHGGYGCRVEETAWFLRESSVESCVYGIGKKTESPKSFIFLI